MTTVGTCFAAGEPAVGHNNCPAIYAAFIFQLPKEPEKFAQVWWTLDDLLGEQWRHNLTGPYPEDENGARLVLEDHEERIREAMIAAGWGAINEILCELVSEE